ncbi:major facilitator superfamily domain-containing protein, partial [Microdochium trichocladiopsis]
LLGPAIPAITSDFRTLDHISWYTSAYLLTQMPFQLVFGRVLGFFEPKLFYMAAMLVFEVGSVLCATAPSSAVFILGRAVSGVGAAGIMAGGFAILGHTPMRERPRLMAFFFAMQSVAYTAGPSISGALTDSYLTWRFNFWIQLPLGVVALATFHFVVDSVPNPNCDLPLLTKLNRCDPISTGLLMSWLVLLFLALEWGGSSLPYSSPQVWGCLLGAGLLAIAFAALQVRKKDDGLVPLRLINQRTVACCCAFSALYGAANVTHITLLPTYLQTVHDISATLSGVYQLPITFSNIISVAISSQAISTWGHFLPFLRAGPLVYLVGSVLFQQLRTTSGPAWYIGSEIPIGAGFGLAIHSSVLAIQVVVSPHDMPLAAVMELFSQQLGRAVGISIAQSIFVQNLQAGLRGVVDASGGNSSTSSSNSSIVSDLAGQGLQEMIDSMKALEPASQAAVREVLNGALTTAFILPVAATAGAAVLTWFVETRTIDVSKKAGRASGGDDAEQTQIKSGGRQGEDTTVAAIGEKNTDRTAPEVAPGDDARVDASGGVKGGLTAARVNTRKDNRGSSY